MAQTTTSKTKFQSPKGTRDLYPDDLLRQRYITEAWRRVSIRHGFDEIAGPTFEHLDLYKIKSGEGIVSELFSFRREGGDDDYALRPEFTPTLARLYAARAASLPSPTKWFTAGPYFRAERPQRGRLREFLQWNCDVIGGEEHNGDAEAIAVLVGLLELLAFHTRGSMFEGARVRISNRAVVQGWMLTRGAKPEHVPKALALMDKRDKLTADQLRAEAKELDVPESVWSLIMKAEVSRTKAEYLAQSKSNASGDVDFRALVPLALELVGRNLAAWCEFDSSIARGLAYYTGTVFELIADGERAVAGGGRYDNLIELFGGPPTPAVGFGMGDVVLGLLLEDKNLMPAGTDLREALSQPGASLRPEAFVIADEDKADLVEPLLANLRRGVEAKDHDPARPWANDRYAIRPMHARRSYRGKRKKQLQDASAQFAMFAVTVNEPDKVELRDMDNPGDDLTPNAIDTFPKSVRSSYADFSVNPESPVYVGRAIASLLG